MRRSRDCSAPTTRIDHDRYRFAKIYNGQNWTPSLTAPLTLPGINIVEGDYLLAVNGRELTRLTISTAFMDGTAGKQTVLRIAKNAAGGDARDVTVVPVDSEHGTAQSRLDRLQPPQGRCSVGRQGRVRLHAGHRGRGLHQLQPLLLLTVGQAGRWCSTSATTRAASSPTTSSMCWVRNC
jgi:hypothetical protein